jgi:hypothetical protein
MMRSLGADDYAAMTEREQLAWQAEQEKPYLAVNGHRMRQHPRYANGRPIYSSAWTACTDNCPACAAGEPLPDY